MEMLQMLLNNYYETAAIIIFAIGFSILLLNRNLIKKLIGLNIADVSVFLFFTSKGFIEGGRPPIIENGIMDANYYVNPVPTALMLTGIVVSICMTAFGLALVQRLYEKYGTLDIDQILVHKKGEVD